MSESVGQFRQRARAWLAAEMPRAPSELLGDGDERWRHHRSLQRRLHEGGFAGLCFPVEYGGRGLEVAYQRAFDEETAGYQLPVLIDVPTLGIIGATLLEFGSEAQKRRYLPPMLRGEEVWVQLLSEPTGGSDLASVTTRAVRDGEHYVLNGSKVWTSGAYAADYGICVVRTRWDVPKHQGISVLIVALDQPGITVDRITAVGGDDEFCQEFFDDVRVPRENLVGRVDEGWTVVLGLLAHERNAMGGGSPYVSTASHVPQMHGRPDLVALARACGRADDPRIRQLVADVFVRERVADQLAERIAGGMASGACSPQYGALLRLMGARNGVHRSDVTLEIAGGRAVASEAGDPALRAGVRFLARQVAELGGGSTEIQRNIISERVLGMPREYAADKGVPFDQARRNAMPTRGGR